MSSSIANKMRKRAGENEYYLYVLVGANRLAIVGVLTFALFAVMVALGTLDGSPLRTQMQSTDTVETVFQGMIGGVITGVTLVLSINQIVLSQELGPLGDLHDEMEGALEFRRDIEEVIDAQAPPEPAAFLQSVIRGCRDQATQLHEAADFVDEPLRDHVLTYSERVVENADAAIDELDDAEFGQYDVVRASLNFNYSWKIHQARRIKDEGDGTLPPQIENTLEDLITTLELFSPLREHVKTMYFQWELVDLSRRVIYAAVLALTVVYAIPLYVDATTFPGATFGIDNLVWIISAGITVGTLPFFVLLSYVLRIATIAKRTLAIGPTVLRTSEGLRPD